jgi:protein-disulfide isomerase
MAQSFLSRYEGRLLFVFKHYPIDPECNSSIPPGNGHRYSCFAAQFVLCAGEQGKFWEAMEYLFETREMAVHHPTVTVKEEVEECMDRLALDSVAVRECLKTGRALGQIKKDIHQGDQLGLAWTPYVLVNGKLLKLADEKALQEVISYILAER